jgi:hypothetical protein
MLETRQPKAHGNLLRRGSRAFREEECERLTAEITVEPDKLQTWVFAVMAVTDSATISYF